MIEEFDSVIIQTEGLTKIYEGKVKANLDINLKVYKGEIFGIVGPNGAGKTTLIRQLTGELMPTSGKIRISGIDVIENPDEIKKIAGVCPQEASLFNYLTVWEHLYYFARLRGLRKEKAKKRVEEVINNLNLMSYKNRLVGMLSGGLKRKVFVALSILGNPFILFLDEPTTGLDPQSRREVWNIIRNMRNEHGTTIILTTHYMEEAEQLCDRVAIIKDGRIVKQGSLEKLRGELKYDLKIRVPSQTFRKISYKLSHINHKLIRHRNHVDILLDKKNVSAAGLVEDILMSLQKEVVLTQPSLEDIYLEVVGYEENTE